MFDKITDLTKTRSIMDSMVFYVGMSVILLGLTTLIGNVLGTVGVGGDVASQFFMMNDRATGYQNK